MQQYVFRPLGMIALAIFVLALPLSLAFREVGKLVFDAEATKTMVRENLLGGQMASVLANQLAQQLFLRQDGEETLASAFVSNTLSALTEEDWRTITALTMPPQLVEATVEEIVNGYTAWLDGDADLPEIRVELDGWKANVEENASAVLSVVLDAQPDCSMEQVSGLVFSALQSMESVLRQIGGCRPPEPVYSVVMDNAGFLLESSLEFAPSSIDVGALRQLAGAPQQLAELKDGLIRIRQMVMWGWLGAIAIGLLGVLLGARTLPQALRWAGWSTLAAGGFTLVFGMGLGLFSLHFVDALLSGPLLERSGAVAILGTAIASGALDFASGPLMMYGLVLLILGGALAYAAYVLAHRYASPGIPINRTRIGW
ncbi:MAG: hypothetical protein KIS88_02230 [Anaerolineales bacterium]|nr:hypothetical protein [Anaerolineales bacterium]